MNRLHTGIAIAAAALLAAIAPAAPRLSGEAKLARLLEGRTAGTPINCLARNPYMRDSSNIEGVGMVLGRGRTVYVNRFTGGCPSLTGFSSIITQTPGNQLCRGDIARIVDATTRIEGGSCIVGDFVPYVRPKK